MPPTATRSVAKNTFLLTFGLCSGRVLALFLTKKMTPILGTEGMGIWFTANDVTAILLTVANFGLGVLLTREITQAPDLSRPTVLGHHAHPLGAGRRSATRCCWSIVRAYRRGRAGHRGRADDRCRPLHRVHGHGLRLGAAGPREGPVPDRGPDRLGGGLLRAGLVVAGRRATA